MKLGCSGTGVSGSVGFHNCSGDFVLEKNEHPLISRKPSIHLCEQVIYAPSPDIDLAVVSLRDEREVQSRLGADYFSISCIEVFMLREFPRSDNILLSLLLPEPERQGRGLSLASLASLAG